MKTKAILTLSALVIVAGGAIASADTVTYPDGHTLGVIEQSKGRAVLDNPQLTEIVQDGTTWYDNGVALVYHSDSEKATHLDAPQHEQPVTPHLDNNVPSQDKASHLDASQHEQPVTPHLDNPQPPQTKPTTSTTSQPVKETVKHDLPKATTNTNTRRLITVTNTRPSSVLHEKASEVHSVSTPKTGKQPEKTNTSVTTKTQVSQPVATHATSSQAKPVAQPTKTSVQAKPVQTLDTLPVTGDDQQYNIIALGVGAVLILIALGLSIVHISQNRKGK